MPKSRHRRNGASRPRGPQGPRCHDCGFPMVPTFLPGIDLNEMRATLSRGVPPCPTFDLEAAMPTLLLGEPWSWECDDDTCPLGEPGVSRIHTTGLAA